MGVNFIGNFISDKIPTNYLKYLNFFNIKTKNVKEKKRNLISSKYEGELSSSAAKFI